MPSPTLRRLALLGLAGLGAACASPREDAVDPAEGEAPIVGDDRADGEQPSVVRLGITQDGLTYTCTGTLLGSRTVITARHCLEKRIGPGGSCDVKVFLDRTGVGTTDVLTEQFAASLCEIREPDKSSRRAGTSPRSASRARFRRRPSRRSRSRGRRTTTTTSTATARGASRRSSASRAATTRTATSGRPVTAGASASASARRRAPATRAARTSSPGPRSSRGSRAPATRCGSRKR